ncbi:MAG: hypothetical protein ACRD2L_22340 [Terriglobia bacterium]
MIRTLALLSIELWVVTAVLAEENLIFQGKELVIVEGPYENAPIVGHAAEGAIHANRNDQLYYLPSCEGYQQISSAELVPFVSEEIATESGYQRAENCS